ncbi:MAG TPA: hypothetical protein VEC11_12590 [Allosphingosinicella sp.]|nr:hypothetical protein [Allosphingosinicella sp.]
MLLATLLTALQPAAPVPAEVHDCAPRVNITAAGPPPPVFHAQRMEVAPERRIFLSLDVCGGGDFRVERRRAGSPEDEREPLQWVPVSQCAALGAWVQAATRLSLPAPMLREHVAPRGPIRGTWYELNARTRTGPGWLGHLTLRVLEPEGAPPNALSSWFKEGERVFQICRDQGHGGEGYAPLRRRPPRPRQ